MKHPTSVYENLTKSLNGIKTIIARVPENDCKTSLHHLKVQSYILLAHAAFEQYIEELAIMTLEESVIRFNNKGVFSKCLVSLIVSETVAQCDTEIPRKAIKSNVVRDLSAFVNLAKRNHLGQILANNGIKKKDQRAILSPVGVEPEDSDSVTYANLDAFGVKRGGVAHQVKMQTNETKSSILSEVYAIHMGLKAFDETACDAINTTMKK